MSKMNSIKRRDFLCAAGLAGTSMFLPRLTLANADTDARFVFIILRGALDGLAAVAPYGDGNYQRMRGELALAAPGAENGALKLDGLFALNPALVNLHARYQARELLVLHAVASPYRDRSHFDGQDLLENGTTAPHGALNGWLNRCLQVWPAAGKRSSEQVAMAFSQNVPLVLRGDARVGSWAPSRLPETGSETLQRIADLYSNDPYFASRLQAAMQADAMAQSSGIDDQQEQAARNNQLASVAGTAGRMLREANGPRLAVMEATGWDTHANQGADKGVLAARLSGLDKALEGLRVELGDAWKKTAVLVATEFGRTVAVNGTRGTDHGTATCAFLVGGAIDGGKVMTDWPGLASGNLYQGRDLKPTLDIRSVCKGVLSAHLGIAESALEEKVFVDSRAAKPLAGLVRA
jgi:uncharacterized protein (DUF1501 family)